MNLDITWAGVWRDQSCASGRCCLEEVGEKDTGKELQWGDRLQGYCGCPREKHGSLSGTGTDGDGEKEQAPEIFTEVDTTGFEGQNKHEGWLQSLLTALLATYHWALFRGSKRFGSTQRSLTPAQSESAVYILKEENQTSKRESNLSLAQIINSIQTWQRLKLPAMC